MSTGQLRVSQRGQMSLPAEARRRWSLGSGGEVDYVDLGDCIVIVPGGADALRRKLLATITPGVWREVRAGFGDPELATE